MKNLKAIVTVAASFLMIASMAKFCFGFAHAESDSSIRAVEIYGPGPVRCYAIMQGEKAVGGNCLKN